jgi:hypothetical protein
MSYILRHLPNGFPDQTGAPEDRVPLLNLNEAASFLGVTPQAFEALAKQYGVGRYHLNRTHDQIVYSMRDLEKIKRGLMHSAA